MFWFSLSNNCSTWFIMFQWTLVCKYTCSTWFAMFQYTLLCNICFLFHFFPTLWPFPFFLDHSELKVRLGKINVEDVCLTIIEDDDGFPKFVINCVDVLFKVGLGAMMVSLNLEKIMDLLVKEWWMIGFCKVKPRHNNNTCSNSWSSTKKF